MSQKADTRNVLKVVTANDFITAYGLEQLPLNSRKLLYLAISQCRMSDKDFFEYTIPIKDFANLMGIRDTNLYQNARKITRKLLSLVLECALNGKDYDQYNVFSKCSYRSKQGIIVFKLNSDMTDFLLNLTSDFSQPLLEDFIRMNSPYSMAIWHLMQREMKSRKPGISQKITFSLTLAELREVTGTQNKLKQVGQFKERVLDKALREIRENCDTKITYQNIKVGRTVVGFQFEAVCAVYRLDESKISQEVKDRVEKKVKELNSKKKEAL